MSGDQKLGMFQDSDEAVKKISGWISLALITAAAVCLIILMFRAVL